MAAADICSTEFLCWLHEGFYRRLPDEFRQVEDEKGKPHEVQPGDLRQGEVSVGRHMAPSSKQLREFLKRFAQFYGPLVTAEPGSLIAAAAAHHRLTWIHPFLDGNGRVARLFTHAWFAKAGVDSDGLWRSEEHTSELQSLRHLVCRLLLEKKKNKKLRPRIRNSKTKVLDHIAYTQVR